MGERDADIRAELGRILASDAFVASPMLASFLRFVVEETLAGREDRLKAYTVAVGALDRPESFDPNDNPVVRVQARRLRQALQRHYETIGADSPLRIDLPLGNYVPVFIETRAPVPSPLVTPVDVAPGREIPTPSVEEGAHSTVVETTWSMTSVVLAALLGVGIGVGGWSLWHSLDRPAAPVVAETESPLPEPSTTVERKGLDAARVLPLLRVDVDLRPPGEDLDADIYRNRIETFASRFDDSIVLTRRSPDYPTQGNQPLYVLGFLLARDGASTNAYYRLLHVGDERILRSGAVSLGSSGIPMSSPGDPTQNAEDLSLVRDFVQLHGAISQDLANLPDLSPELSCLTRAWSYYQDSSPANHLAARNCLEAVVADNPRLVPAAALLGGVYLGEYRQKINPMPGDPIARAERILRTAIRIAPTSSAPYQTLQSLLLIKGDAAAALQAGARSIELNPQDMNAVGRYGSLLARLGRYEEAITLLQRAEAGLSSPPRWLQYYAFLALNNLGRTDEADRFVTFFQGTQSTLFLTAVAIRAHRLGDAAAAAAALSEIARREPGFSSDSRAFLRRQGLTGPVIDRLMVDLEAAGLRDAMP